MCYADIARVIQKRTWSAMRMRSLNDGCEGGGVKSKGKEEEEKEGEPSKGNSH